jgi:argininosuccinate lyase
MKLWQKNYTLDALIEKFTVGNDYLLDHALVPFDCQASIAHASMLAHVGLLTQQEATQLSTALQEIIELWSKGCFAITPSDEDCHTAIENHLTKKLGALGQKIHTGRSRNDQVLTALRLYEKDALAKVQVQLKAFQQTAAATALTWQDIPLPGYTHMRKAMPTTVDVWLDAYAHAVNDDLTLLDGLLKLIDQCPLGSGAGFGVPTLPLDPGYTAKALGFAQHFTNPMHIHATRGKYEANIVHLASQIIFDLNKCATDIVTLSMSEFGFFVLAPQVCTGSSIMPQKKNPDALELVRGYYHVVCGYEVAIKGIAGNLMSGYHRDLQLIKQPVMSSLDITLQALEVMTIVLQNLRINPQRCADAMTHELYATEKVYELVKQGVPFRQAYQMISKEYFEKDNHEELKK